MPARARAPRLVGGAPAFDYARSQILDLALDSSKLHFQFWHLAGGRDADFDFPLRLLDLPFNQRRLVLEIGELPSCAHPVDAATSTARHSKAGYRRARTSQTRGNSRRGTSRASTHIRIHPVLAVLWTGGTIPRLLLPQHISHAASSSL